MRYTRLHIVALAVLVVALAIVFPVTAFARSLDPGTDWKVTFTSDGKMSDTFLNQEWEDAVSGLQPGDDITFTVKLLHENATACDWYMSNDVIKSLEDSDEDAAGSAYEYLLTYAGPSGGEPKVLYGKDKNTGNTIGGDADDTKNLHDATSGLKDFLYLDNLKKGQEGTVTLKVTLDGETEGNAYFDTLARLKMKFAVEMSTNNNNSGNKSGTSAKTTGGRTSVRTGDETNLFPFYVVMIVAGLGLLALGVANVRRNKREQAGSHSRLN